MGLESSGPIAVLTLAFVAGLGWRKPGSEVRPMFLLSLVMSAVPHAHNYSYIARVAL